MLTNKTMSAMVPISNHQDMNSQHVVPLCDHVDCNIQKWVDFFDEKGNDLCLNEPKDLKEGWIYIAFTIVLPDLLKLGFTCMSNVNKRIKQLSSSTASAEEFSLVCAVHVSDARLYEKAVHLYFSDARIYGKRKEFFAIDKKEAIKLFERIKGSVDWDDKSYRRWKMAFSDASHRQPTSHPTSRPGNSTILSNSTLQVKAPQMEDTETVSRVARVFERDAKYELYAQQEANVSNLLLSLKQERTMHSENLQKMKLKKTQLKLKRKELSLICKSMKAYAKANNGEQMDPETSVFFKDKIVALMRS